jgi:hypothetical protein
VVLAAGIAAGAGCGLRVPAGASESAALLRDRGATYRALIAALQDGPDRRFRCRHASVATRNFARWYSQQDAGVRGHVDAVLDALASRRRLSYTRLAHAASKGDPVVAAAVALASVACDPPLGEDERPIAPALVTPL